MEINLALVRKKKYNFESITSEFWFRKAFSLNQGQAISTKHITELFKVSEEIVSAAWDRQRQFKRVRC